MRLNKLKVGMTKDIAPLTVDEEEMLSFQDALIISLFILIKIIVKIQSLRNL